MRREDEDDEDEGDAEGSADGHEGEEPVVAFVSLEKWDFVSDRHTMVYQALAVIELP